MTQCAETLATAFEQVVSRMTTEIERLSDTAWNAVPAGEARTAGQIASHMVQIYHNVSGFIGLAAAGQPLPAWTMEDIHGFNAEQAADSAGADRAGVLETLRHNSAITAAVLRGLSDAQLDTSLVFVGYSLTVEGLAQNALVGHTEEHLASIRDAAST